MGLLWTTINQVAPAYPQTVTVKNAPVADQARLLSDLEEKAIGRIIARGRIDNKVVGARVTVLENVAMRCQTVCIAMEVNGQDFSFTYDVHERNVLDSPHEVIEAAHRQMAEAITAQLLGRVL